MNPTQLDNYQSDDMTQIRSWLFSLVLLSPMLLVNGAVLMNRIDVGYVSEGEYIFCRISMLTLVGLLFLISICVNADFAKTHPIIVGIVAIVFGILVVYWYDNIDLELGAIFKNARVYHFTTPAVISIGCLIAVVIPGLVSGMIAPNKTGNVFLLVFSGLVFAREAFIFFFILPFFIDWEPSQTVNRLISSFLELMVFASPGAFQLLTRKKQQLSWIMGFVLLVLLAASLATIIWAAYGGGWAYLDQEMSNGFEQLRQNIVD